MSDSSPKTSSARPPIHDAPDETTEDTVLSREVETASPEREQPSSTDETVAEPSRELKLDDEVYGGQGTSYELLDEATQISAAPFAKVAAAQMETDEFSALISLDSLAPSDFDDTAATQWQQVKTQNYKRSGGASAQTTQGSPAPVTALGGGDVHALLKTLRRARPPEQFPLLGEGSEARRLKLLEHLAVQAAGSAKARLVGAAQELVLETDGREAFLAHVAAHTDGESSDLASLRRARRAAMQRRDWPRCAELLTAEVAQEPSKQMKSRLLTLAALLAQEKLSDATRAKQSLEKAVAEDSANLSAHLMLIALLLRSDDVEQLIPRIEAAEVAVRTDAVSASLWQEAARSFEAHRLSDKAMEAYHHAAQSGGDAFLAWLGIARCARHTGDREELSKAALALQRQSGSAVIAELLAVETQAPSLPGDDVESLETLASLRKLVAEHEGTSIGRAESARTEAARAKWITKASGRERAFLLLEASEAREARGEVDQAYQALQDALDADPTLLAPQVYKERWARKGLHPSSALADEQRVQDRNQRLEAAARRAARGGDVAQEFEVLQELHQLDSDALEANVLLVDAAFAASSTGSATSAITQLAGRASGEYGASLLAALCRLDKQDALSLLSEATQRSSASKALWSFALATQSTLRNSDEAMWQWVELASSSEGERSAFAWHQAALQVAELPEESRNSLYSALRASPTYAACLPLLEHTLLALDAGERLASVFADVAGRETDPKLQGYYAARAALKEAGNSDAERALLRKAGEVLPQDLSLQQRLISHKVYTSAQAAQAMAATGRSIGGATGDTYLLHAARLWEEAAEPQLAALLYRELLSRDELSEFVEAGLERSYHKLGEYTRLTERIVQQIKQSEDPAARVSHLERLATIDGRYRRDKASSVMSWRAVLEIDPRHPAALRAVERFCLEQQRDEELLSIATRRMEELADTSDVHAYFAMALRLQTRLNAGDVTAGDSLTRAFARRNELNLWSARKLWASCTAEVRPEERYDALVQFRRQLEDVWDKAQVGLDEAELLGDNDELLRAIDTLAPVVEALSEHPVAVEELGRIFEQAGLYLQAAQTYEQAALASNVTRRQVFLYYRAGLLWEEHVMRQNDAIRCFEQAAIRDVNYLDVFERLRSMLDPLGSTERLAKVLHARIQGGGEPRVLVELYLRLAAIERDLGRVEASRDAYRAALALDPNRIDVLQNVAKICFDTGDWQGAAEALIRLARLTKERQELSAIFSHLGDIYQTRLNDPDRAVAAYRRVLDLQEDDLHALKQLSKLQMASSNYVELSDTLQRLARLETDASKNMRYRLDLARVWLRLEKPKRAEEVLEGARRISPLNLELLAEMAEFYRNQGAGSALAIHLNRAVSDFRRAIERDASDSAAWTGLVDILLWQKLDDAAVCVGRASIAMGLTDVKLATLIEGRASRPPAAQALAASELDELLAPPLLTHAVRSVLALSSPALDKLYPFDTRAYGLERLSAGSHPFLDVVAEVAQELGLQSLPVWVSKHSPHLCLPLSHPSPGLAIGPELLHHAESQELRFLAIRAAKLLQVELASACRLRPEDLALSLWAMAYTFDTSFTPPGVSHSDLKRHGKKLLRLVPRKHRTVLIQNAVETVSLANFRPDRIVLAARSFANRFALLATASPSDGLNALLKASGKIQPARATLQQRVLWLKEVPEAYGLVAFSISDTYFESRRRTLSASDRSR